MSMYSATLNTLLSADPTYLHISTLDRISIQKLKLQADNGEQDLPEQLRICEEFVTTTEDHSGPTVTGTPYPRTSHPKLSNERVVGRPAFILPAMVTRLATVENVPRGLGEPAEVQLDECYQYPVSSGDESSWTSPMEPNSQRDPSYELKYEISPCASDQYESDSRVEEPQKTLQVSPNEPAPPQRATTAESNSLSSASWHPDSATEPCPRRNNYAAYEPRKTSAANAAWIEEQQSLYLLCRFIDDLHRFPTVLTPAIPAHCRDLARAVNRPNTPFRNVIEQQAHIRLANQLHVSCRNLSVKLNVRILSPLPHLTVWDCYRIFLWVLGEGGHERVALSARWSACFRTVYAGPEVAKGNATAVQRPPPANNDLPCEALKLLYHVGMAKVEACMDRKLIRKLCDPSIREMIHPGRTEEEDGEETSSDYSGLDVTQENNLSRSSTEYSTAAPASYGNPGEWDAQNGIISDGSDFWAAYNQMSTSGDEINYNDYLTTGYPEGDNGEWTQNQITDTAVFQDLKSTSPCTDITPTEPILRHSPADEALQYHREEQDCVGPQSSSQNYGPNDADVVNAEWSTADIPPQILEQTSWNLPPPEPNQPGQIEMDRVASIMVEHAETLIRAEARLKGIIEAGYHAKKATALGQPPPPYDAGTNSAQQQRVLLHPDLEVLIEHLTKLVLSALEFLYTQGRPGCLDPETPPLTTPEFQSVTKWARSLILSQNPPLFIGTAVAPAVPWGKPPKLIWGNSHESNARMRHLSPYPMRTDHFGYTPSLPISPSGYPPMSMPATSNPHLRVPQGEFMGSIMGAQRMMKGEEEISRRTAVLPRPPMHSTTGQPAIAVLPASPRDPPADGVPSGHDLPAKRPTPHMVDLQPLHPPVHSVFKSDEPDPTDPATDPPVRQGFNYVRASRNATRVGQVHKKRVSRRTPQRRKNNLLPTLSKAEFPRTPVERQMDQFKATWRSACEAGAQRNPLLQLLRIMNLDRNGRPMKSGPKLNTDKLALEMHGSGATIVPNRVYITRVKCGPEVEVPEGPPEYGMAFRRPRTKLNIPPAPPPMPNPSLRKVPNALPPGPQLSGPQRPGLISTICGGLDLQQERADLENAPALVCLGRQPTGSEDYPQSSTSDGSIATPHNYSRVTKSEDIGCVDISTEIITQSNYGRIEGHLRSAMVSDQESLKSEANNLIETPMRVTKSVVEAPDLLNRMELSALRGLRERLEREYPRIANELMGLS